MTAVKTENGQWVVGQVISEGQFRGWRVAEIDGDVATLESPSLDGLRVEQVPRSLSDCHTDDQLRAWAQRHVLSVIAEHPGEEERATALLGLGVLVGLGLKNK